MALKKFDQDLLTRVFEQTEKVYAKKTTVDELEKKVDDIVTEGGEPNVIEKIAVNGEVQEVVDKLVNILVPTKTSDLENDEGYQTEQDVALAVAKIVDDAPEAYDTLKEIADWIENHSDSAAEMNSQIQTNKTNIADLTALIGELPEGTAATTIVEYIDDAVKDIDLSEYLKESDFEDFTDEEITEAYDEAVAEVNGLSVFNIKSKKISGGYNEAF